MCCLLVTTSSVTIMIHHHASSSIIRCHPLSTSSSIIMNSIITSNVTSVLRSHRCPSTLSFPPFAPHSSNGMVLVAIKFLQLLSWRMDTQTCRSWGFLLARHGEERHPTIWEDVCVNNLTLGDDSTPIFNEQNHQLTLVICCYIYIYRRFVLPNYKAL